MLMNIDLLNRYDIKPKCILHVGAHEAEEKDIYKQMGCSKVLWIESMKEKYQTILNVIKNEPNMDVVIATVWSSDNELLNFYQTNNGQSSSVFELDKHKELYPSIEVSNILNVTTKTIDTIIFKDMNQKYIPDMICIDIQGAELEAFRGATKTLDTVKYIYTEVSYDTLYKSCTLEPELTNFLNNLNFKKIEEVDTGMKWGDALYVKIKS